ncbi:pre-mRNA 3'-end-processing factor FIP1 isoform X2 [Eleginops maclovinus]|uniref:pre-mRNA 3'-end-processing factor FIP1 isoform X2 n=1 Tax=Eleginops maclovinus TaxID=56733 RepID=UPI00308015B4
MYSSELDSIDSTGSEDEEGKIYQLIYDLIPENDKEEKEDFQILCSSEDIPVPLKIDAERSVPSHTVAYNDTRGLYMEEFNYFEEIPAQNGTESPREKPWRSAGADITDYFNYGFDEEIWNMYCKKQAQVHATNRKLYLGQKGHTRQEEKDCSAYPSSGSPTSRQPSATNNVIGGKPGTSRKVKRHNYQVVTEMSPEADRVFHHVPSPSNFNSLFAFTSPPPHLYRGGPPALASLDSEHSKGFDDPSTSQPCSSGVSYFIPRNMALNAGVRETAKAWEFILRQEEGENSREKSRKRVRAKGSRRGRDRNRGRCSTPHRKLQANVMQD